MNWRILFVWGFTMLCLSQLPASLVDPNCSNVFQNLGIAGGGIVSVFFALKWVWQKWMEKHSYTVFFRRDNHRLSDITDFWAVPTGTQFIDVMVRAERKVSIEHADIRFVIDKNHLQNPRSDADTDDIEITSAEDLDIPSPRFSWKAGLDQAGGVDLWYLPAYNRVKGDFLRIRIKVEAKRGWQGFISFRESRIYSYHPFRVVKK